jgi:hypothetical protein
MTEPYDPLFAIEVDTDNYAETAATDIPSVSRTHQSEDAFAAIKASYQAKQDHGNIYAELLRTVPLLDPAVTQKTGDADGAAKPKFGKREQQLLGYTVGELYYDGEYSRIVEVCGRVREKFEVPGKLEEALERWTERAEGRLGEVGEVGG